jgi:medium-chain acyl-[acyl-carrier-protein] hydrolase
LFCLPYAGGSASLYRDWAAQLPDTVEVCPVQLPGREQRLDERPFSRIEPLVEALAVALRPQLDIPFALFGHSMGALIAFELARQLRRQGLPMPVHLFASGRHAPHRPDPVPPIHNVPDETLLAEVRRLQGTPDGIWEDPELRALFLPILRADFSVNESYRHIREAPLACGISAFGGLEDYKVGREDLTGWRQHTQGAFALRMLPGGHFFMRESASTRLLHAISAQLTRA